MTGSVRRRKWRYVLSNFAHQYEPGRGRTMLRRADIVIRPDACHKFK